MFRPLDSCFGDSRLRLGSGLGREGAEISVGRASELREQACRAAHGPAPRCFVELVPPLIWEALQAVLVVKNPPARAGDAREMVLIPASRRPLEVGNDNPLQYSYLENPADRGAWQASVHGFTRR